VLKPGTSSVTFVSECCLIMMVTMNEGQTCQSKQQTGKELVLNFVHPYFFMDRTIAKLGSTSVVRAGAVG